MPIQVLIAHAKGEEEAAEKLAVSIRDGGFDVWHHGSVMVGESITEEASKVLSKGGPVILCGTIKAVGTKWAKLVVNAARQYPGVKVFIVQMDEEADVDSVAFDHKIARYWEDPTRAIDELITALKKYYSSDVEGDYHATGIDAEKCYREIALKSFDIIDLTNLPETDKYRATQQLELRRLYVALRVKVEVAADAEVDEAKLAAIEQHRNALRRNVPAWNERISEEKTDVVNRTSIGERLSETCCLVVLGDPGAGKTTMLRWIATAYLLRLKNDEDWRELPDVDTLPAENWLPILIRCRDFDQSKPPESLTEMLRQSLRRAEIPEATATTLLTILINKVARAEAILLIDGLDEITDPTMRANFCQQVEQIHVANSKTPIIVTSRIVGYRELGDRIGRGFEHVTVADLSKKDKDNFANLWSAITERAETKSAAAAELIQDIHSTDRIERLTSNPMLLTTMALVKRKVGRLPTRRVALYGDALEVLLNWRRTIGKPLDWQEAVPQLAYIAYAMCDRGVQQLRRDEVIELLTCMREEYPSHYSIQEHTPEEFLQLLERQTGILVQAGSVRHLAVNTPVYEFRHLTFQEYLAARALIDGYYPGRDRSRSLAEEVAPLAGRINEKVQSDSKEAETEIPENWREVLRLIVAACRYDEVDNVLLAILRPTVEEEASITTRPRAILAGLCLADEPTASVEVVQALLRQLVSQINGVKGEGSVDKEVDAAIKELATSRWAGILQRLLLEEYSQRDATGRTSVGNIYGTVSTISLKEKSALIDWLKDRVEKLSGDQEHERIGAALGIRKLAVDKKVQILPGLISGLFHMLSQGGAAAHAAATALNKLNETQTHFEVWLPSLSEVETLISFIQDASSDEGAMLNVIPILGRERDQRAIHPITLRLDDKNASIRAASVRALGAIKSSQSVTALIAKLEDEDSKVQRAAAFSLGKIEDSRATLPLINSLKYGTSDVREAVVWALGSIRDARSVESLLTSLNDESSGVREYAVGSLSQIGPQGFEEQLLNKLEDESEDVRFTVVMNIPGYKSTYVMERLRGKLADESSNVRLDAAVALGLMGDNVGLDRLVATFESDNASMQSMAMMALSQISDQYAVAPLLSKLSGDVGAQQVFAAMVLKRNKSIEKIEPLLAKLNSEKGRIRPLLISALDGLEDDRIIDPLLACLKDDDKTVRKAAIEVLAKFTETRVVDQIIEKLNDIDPEVRREAAKALGNVKDIRSIEPLILCLKDESNEVRGSAAEALGKIKADTAVDYLVTLLDDENAIVRQISARALGTMKATQAVEPLISKLESEYSSVRVPSSWALGQIGDNRALNPLLTKLDDNNRGVQETVKDAVHSFAVERFSVGDLKGAVELFKKLAEVLPNDDLRNNLAFCLMLLKRHSEAAEQSDLINYSTRISNRPLWQNNRGLLSFLLGDEDKGRGQLREALGWVEEAGDNYDARNVYSVLLLKGKDTVAPFEGIPVDAALLINLFNMDGISTEELTDELSKRYPVEYGEWIQLLPQLEDDTQQYIN